MSLRNMLRIDGKCSVGLKQMTSRLASRKVMRLSTFAATVALSFFVLPASGDQSRSPAAYAKVDAFVSEPLGVPAIDTLANLRKLGPVLDEKVSIVPNLHTPSQKDEVRTLQFDGLVINAYFAGRDHSRGIVGGIAISKSNWKLQFGLHVGSSVDDVIAALGKPDEQKSGAITYCGDVSCGTFFLLGSRVTKITFEGSVD